MEEIEILRINYSGNSIAKNTLYNLSGNIIPALFAIILIPPLLKGLGTERFGILSISWMIIGYFSFFDFGIGKAITKIIAEKIGSNQVDHISKIFWTSLVLILCISLFASILISFFVPSLVKMFNISPIFQSETISIFYILAIAIPIVTTMTGLRGFLEAYQKFAIINIMKVILGMFTFLGPLLVLIMTNSLFWIILFLVFMRIAIWIFYLLQCLEVQRKIKSDIKIDFKSIKPVLKFSLWITVANIIGPIILYSDRFLIGTLISVIAITYYVTPYELASRLLMIPVALSGVLFPIFSASYVNNPDTTKKILIRGVKFILLIMYPFILLIVTFSYEGIDLWLGKDFAIQSSLILQLLATGILMNSLSLIPNNFFQGIGKPRIPALINLIEFPFYILMMWFFIKFNGIKGAAFAFMIMAGVDAGIMYLAAYKMTMIKLSSKSYILPFVIMIIFLILSFFISGFLIKVIFALTFLILFVSVTWIHYLTSDEKRFFIQNIKKLNILSN